MAADHKKGFFLFRPKFLLFCLYVAAYVMLRMHGEIVYQQVAVPGQNGGVQVFRMVSADPHIPYWRQQAWRGVFSLAMVVEEEGQPVIIQVRRLINRAQQDRNGNGSLVDRAVEAGRNLLPNQAPQQQQQRSQSAAPQQYQYQAEPQYYAPAPQQQQQQQYRQQRAAPAGYGQAQQPVEGLREGERMIFDPRVQR